MNARKLQAYASLAEVVSAAAIIVSLLYVGYEFRRTGTLTSREVDVMLFELGNVVADIVDESTWSDWDEWFTAEARRRPTFAWTENRRHFTGESFRRHVDSALSERVRSESTDRP